jgi:hypothetical protein
MTMRQLLGAGGFAVSLTLFASPAVAKGVYWYTVRYCLFHPGGGHRTPAETIACRKQRAIAGETLRFCRDQNRRGPLPCGPNQEAVSKVVR